MSDRLDALLHYDSLRRNAERTGFWLIATALVALAFSLSDKYLTLSFIDDAIAGIHVIVVGPAVLGLFAWYYCKQVSGCCAVRDALIQAQRNEELGPASFNAYERHLLCPPYGNYGEKVGKPPREAWRYIGCFSQWIHKRFPLFVALLVCCVLLRHYGYHLRNPASDDFRTTAVGWWKEGRAMPSGFQAHWKEGNGWRDVILKDENKQLKVKSKKDKEKLRMWIHPPWYSLGYLAVLSWMLFRFICPPRGVLTLESHQQ